MTNCHSVSPFIYGCACGIGIFRIMRVFHLTLRHFDLIVMLRHAHARHYQRETILAFARMCALSESGGFFHMCAYMGHYQRAEPLRKIFCRPAVMTSETAPEPPPTADRESLTG